MIQPVTEITYRNKYYNINRKEIKNQPYINSANILNKASDNFVNTYYMPTNITFKGNMLENSTAPAETTTNYIPENKGTNHLDLPNIRIFEYPDTNLRVLININKNTNPNTKPIISIFSLQTKDNDYNLLREKLLQTIIENQLLKIDSESIFVGAPWGFSYNYPKTNNPEKYAGDINNIIFDLHFNNDEFSAAKQELIEKIKDDNLNYESGNLFKILFDNNELKTKDEMIDELNNLSINEFKAFYDNYKNNMCLDVFIICPNEYFENNKNQIFQNLNLNISNKLKQRTQRNTEDVIIKNQSIKYITTNYTDIIPSLNYLVPDANYKTQLISYITSSILDYNLQRYGFRLLSNDGQFPYELKDNTPKMCSGKYYSVIKSDEGVFTNDDIEKFNNTVSEIISKNLPENLETEKYDFKNVINYFINYPEITPERKLVFKLFFDKLLTFNNDVDNISKADIEDYINNYILMQEPIVVTGISENKHEDI